MKILTTGNPEFGLAFEINKIMISDFVGSHNDYDLMDDEVIKAVVEHSLNYDVFINNIRLHSFQQTKILSLVAEFWAQNKKNGKIINIGSVADRALRSTKLMEYSSEKISLKQLSTQLHYLHAHKKHTVSSTYIAFGYMNTENCHAHRIKSIKKMTVIEAANIIKWNLECPSSLAIEEIRIEPVQI